MKGHKHEVNTALNHKESFFKTFAVIHELSIGFLRLSLVDIQLPGLSVD